MSSDYTKLPPPPTWDINDYQEMAVVSDTTRADFYFSLTSAVYSSGGVRDQLNKLKRDISEGTRLVRQLEVSFGTQEIAIQEKLYQWARGCGYAHTPPDVMERVVSENKELRERLAKAEQRTNGTSQQ